MTKYKNVRPNCFTDYVASLEWEKIDSVFREASEAEEQLKHKTISIRLDPEMLQTADNLANYLGLSRQKFIAELIDGGIGAALESISSVRFQATSKDDLTDEQQDQLLKDIHHGVVQEFVS